MIDYDPDGFINGEMGHHSTCRRCGLLVGAQRAHHDWHVALDGALADAGATMGPLMEVSRLRVDLRRGGEGD